jgi:O-acetylserine/cysteine efflux transporter
MTRHPAGVVAPFSMLVPVFGMSAAWVVLGETVTWRELAGGVLVVVGVLLGSMSSARSRTAPPSTPPQTAPTVTGVASSP